ncbi:hypothetical protein JCM5353_006514 [Sporobolomyces roseus]
MRSSSLLLALASLSIASPTPATPVLLALSPRSLSPSSQLPDCALYLSTIGVETLSDVYYLDSQCSTSYRGLVAGEEETRVIGIPQDLFTPSLSSSSSQSELSRLVWIHLPKLDITDPSSYKPEIAPSPSPSSQEQLLFSSTPSIDEIASLTPTHLVSIPSSPSNDTEEGSLFLLSTDSSLAMKQLEFLTSHPSTALFTIVSIPQPSNTRTLDEPKFPEVPKQDVKRVESWLKNLEFEPLLSELMRGIKTKEIEKDVRTLSGEDQEALKEDKRWVSRHSMSTGAMKASSWLLSQMRSYDFHCTPHQFLPGFSPMLECVYARSGREVNETVVLGAHYDSRGSFGFPTAPGADDDASGTSLVLAVARQIHLNRLVFSRKLVLALFAGEEQGLLGSNWYARYLKEDLKESVVWMLQVDMVGYRAPSEPPQLALPDLIGLPQAAYLVGNISNTYVPELVVGRTSACCSDHQSFVQNAIASTWIFERNGPIADPCYHSSCDLSQRPGYDFEQIAMHTKVAFGTMWVVGGGRVE